MKTLLTFFPRLPRWMSAILMLFLMLPGALTIQTRANDGVYFVSGNHLVPLMETDISIDKEVLTITLTDEGYALVDVVYELLNPGAEKTLLMGFEADAPYNAEYALHHDGVHPYIKDFTVTLNGKALPYSSAVASSDLDNLMPLDLGKWKHGSEDSKTDEMIGIGNVLYNAQADSIINFAYVSYFNAVFPSGRSTVHHTYRYTLSYNVCSLYTLSYKLTPCTRWATGKVRDFTLYIKAENTAKDFLIESTSAFLADTFTIEGEAGKQRILKDKWDIERRQIVLRNASAVIHKTDFAPESELVLSSTDAAYCDEQDLPLGTFYDRSEGYRPRNLAGLTSEHKKPLDKRILRNLPYAFRGYAFKDTKLKKYFSQFFWYMPNERVKDTDAVLSKKEQQFVSGTYQED